MWRYTHIAIDILNKWVYCSALKNIVDSFSPLPISFQRELSLTKELHSKEKSALEKRVASAGDQSSEAAKKIGEELEATKKQLQEKETRITEIEDKLEKEERDKDEAIGEAAQLKEELEVKDQVCVHVWLFVCLFVSCC